MSLHQNWADMLLKCKHQGSSAPFAAGQRIRTICSWAETSEALLFHGLQAAGSEPKAAKVDEGWLESRSASSVFAPAGALWRRVVGLLRYGGQQQKQVVVCWGGGGLEPSGSQSERAGLGQQAASWSSSPSAARRREKLKVQEPNRDKGPSECWPTQCSTLPMLRAITKTNLSLKLSPDRRYLELFMGHKKTTSSP